MFFDVFPLTNGGKFVYIDRSFERVPRAGRACTACLVIGTSGVWTCRKSDSMEKGPEPFVGKPLEVRVDERGLDRALRRLRRITASEGILREMKRRRHYEKPSQASKRKLREAARRRKRRMKRSED